jgi:hypothetical protein
MARSVETGSTVFRFLLRMVKEEKYGLLRVNASETSRSSSAVPTSAVAHRPDSLLITSSVQVLHGDSCGGNDMASLLVIRTFPMSSSRTSGEAGGVRPARALLLRRNGFWFGSRWPQHVLRVLGRISHANRLPTSPKRGHEGLDRAWGAAIFAWPANPSLSTRFDMACTTG